MDQLAAAEHVLWRISGRLGISNTVIAKVKSRNKIKVEMKELGPPQKIKTNIRRLLVREVLKRGLKDAPKYLRNEYNTNVHELSKQRKDS